MAQAARAAVFLFGDEAFRQRRVGAQQRAGKAPLRLREVHDQRAGHIFLSALVRTGGDAPDLDALRGKAQCQCFSLIAALGQVEHDIAVLCVCAIGHRAAPEAGIIGEVLCLVARHDFQGRQRGQHIVAHTIAIGQILAVIAGKDQPARGGLFEGHRNRAVQARPHVAIARIEGVEDLTRKIGHAEPVEPGAMIAAHLDLLGALARRDVRVVGVCRRREVIGLVAAHLMAVDIDNRMPFQHAGDLALSFRLGHREPIAVHVEQIVVVAPARPGLVMLGSIAVALRFHAERGLERVDEPVPPVGVLARIDDDNHIVQNGLDQRIILRSQQVVGQEQRTVAGRDLVSMDIVGEPDHCRRGAGKVRHRAG